MQIKSKLAAITFLLIVVFSPGQVAKANQSGVCSWGSSSYTWVADFNLDGKADIASANGGNVYVYLSTGLDFTLETWTVPNSWGAPEYTWVADFNGDGRADIASANGGNVYMHLSTGTSFTNLTWTVPNSWGSSGYTWVADFNGDKRADIASGSGNNVFMNLSKKDGTGFDSSTWHVNGSWGSPGYTWVADFNGDRNADIVTAIGSNIFMHMSTGSRFNPTTGAIPVSWGAPEYTWVADFNGDGRADIASANGGNVDVLLSTGSSFEEHNWPVNGAWGAPEYTWVADFNGDKKADIASANGGNVYMHLSTGTSFTNLTWTVPNSWGSSGYTWVADFNGDGRADIASADGCIIHMRLSLGNSFANQDWSATVPTARKGYIRKNIYTLTPAEIDSIRAGVKAMKGKPESDPTSWVYQAKMHGVLGTVIGPQNNCQHAQFFFLSWHRMYVYYFERILRNASNNPNLTLPYWNYTDVAVQRVIPEAYRLPADASNSLYDGTREAIYNAGSALPEPVVQYNPAFQATNFTTTTQGATSFGGMTSWLTAHEADASGKGLLEQTPHDTVHATIGGDMGAVETAALDPIFWLHHANIDRLWDRWIALGNGRENPISNGPWMNQVFFFFDEFGAQVSLTGSQILDTALQLNYRYDDSIPLDLSARATPRRSTGPNPPQEKIIASEVLAAQKQPTTLTKKRTVVSLDFQPGKKRSLLRSFQNRFKNEKVVLQIKGIKFDEPVGVTYLLYLNLPGSVPDPDHNNPYFVGALGFFGRTGPSANSSHGAPAGFTNNYDITQVLLRLGDVSNVRLIIIPSYPKAPAGREDIQKMIDAMKPKGNPRFDEVVVIKHRLE
jgi:hypothetical protein